MQIPVIENELASLKLAIGVPSARGHEAVTARSAEMALPTISPTQPEVIPRVQAAPHFIPDSGGYFALFSKSLRT